MSWADCDDAVTPEPVIIPFEELEIMAARVGVLAAGVRRGAIDALDVALRLEAIERGLLAWAKT